MYVCVCAAVTKSELEETIKNTESLEDALDELGAGSACCTCLPELNDIYITIVDMTDK